MGSAFAKLVTDIFKVTAGSGEGSSSSSSSGSVQRQDQADHARFCEQCDKKMDEAWRLGDEARRRGDIDTANRYYNQADQHDIAAHNDLRDRMGWPRI